MWIPDRCPENMLLYPGDGNISTWICDCRPRYLYFPNNNSCYEAYRQGPCSLEYYVVLPDQNVIPKCVKNPCLIDGLVFFNQNCYPLKKLGGPCGSKGVLNVNTTFHLECMPVF